MSRASRSDILYDGCYVHVFSRSVDQIRIFEKPGDFEKFKSLLGRFKGEFQCSIHHYCLMHTHFHLVVSVGSLPLFSKAMKMLKFQYSYWFNRVTHRSGALWCERFKSMLIEDGAYLYACGLYVESNPVRAKMVGRDQDWPYSSSRFYRLSTKDALVEPYDQENVPEGVDINDEQFFTKGKVIGSSIFRMHIEEHKL